MQCNVICAILAYMVRQFLFLHFQSNRLIYLSLLVRDNIARDTQLA